MHGTNDGDRLRRMTLREVFEAVYVDGLDRDSTKDAYFETIRAWERHTSDPPVGEVDDRTAARFRDALRAANLKNTSINRHWGHAKAILRRLGPQETGNPQGLGVLSRIPYLKKLPEHRGFPRVVTNGELNRLYAACEAAQWPRCDVEPPTWWRALLVLLFNAGPRIGDVREFRPGDVDFEGRQLRFRARKTSKLQAIPLNATTLAHVEAMWTRRERLFPGVEQGTHSNKFYRQLHELQDEARVEPFGPHTLRKSCGTRYAEHAGPDVACWILGHAVPGVTAQFYINPTRRIVEAVDTLPQPDAFLAPVRPAIVGPVRRVAWEFGDRSATFGDVTLRLGPRVLACLRAFVAAGGPLSFDDLARVVWWDRPDVDRTTIKTTVFQLRRALRAGFGLPATWNPLPRADAGTDRWILSLPKGDDDR